MISRLSCHFICTYAIRAIKKSWPFARWLHDVWMNVVIKQQKNWRHPRACLFECRMLCMFHFMTAAWGGCERAWWCYLWRVSYLVCDEWVRWCAVCGVYVHVVGLGYFSIQQQQRRQQRPSWQRSTPTHVLFFSSQLTDDHERSPIIPQDAHRNHLIHNRLPITHDLMAPTVIGAASPQPRHVFGLNHSSSMCSVLSADTVISIILYFFFWSLTSIFCVAYIHSSTGLGSVVSLFVVLCWFVYVPVISHDFLCCTLWAIYCDCWIVLGWMEHCCSIPIFFSDLAFRGNVLVSLYSMSVVSRDFVLYSVGSIL